MLSEAAFAKVNLYLHVTGRRADGYHLLDSLAVFPEIGDVLAAESAPELSLVVEGRFAAPLAGSDNLVLRAARALDPTRGAALRLIKNLPVASGIGGGSADAAAALRLLSRLWQCDVPAGTAMALGADVAVCLASLPARMQGIGEVLLAAPRLPRFGMVLVNPGVAVATPAVFASRAGAFSSPAILPGSWADAAAMARDLAGLANDLEAPAVGLCPVITDVLAAIRGTAGCLLARMSGSGATCFGVYALAAQASAAATALARSGWWSWGGPCGDTPA
ncbi:MAG: 4-(cytidine 5'-diphospho)-2-C-methyl-D-erythritol kinase [Rhodospirillales bacterium]|nr:4-(cytidine 5'-diphospho)-2-C-methyl-D-erythritol kinase [Rhodospirillales bacterium]